MNKFERLCKALPSLYKPELNVMVGGLLKAWAISDENLEVQISNAKDQLFVKTAADKYLNALGSNAGVDRSAELGLDDDTFRGLIPILSFYPKQVRETMIALLDVFWGAGFTRANVSSGNSEVFNFGTSSAIGGTAIFIKDSNIVQGLGTNFLSQVVVGDYIKPTASSGHYYAKVSQIISDTELELTLPWSNEIVLNTSVVKGIIRELQYSVDKNRYSSTIRFIPNAFEDLESITAQELVTFINNNLEHSKYITASAFYDPIGGTKLNLRTNTPGLQGSIQINGGDANIVSRLNFDIALHNETKAAVYEINPNEIVVRIPSSVPVLRRSLKGSSHPRQTKAELFSSIEPYNFSSLGASSTLDITIDGTPYVVTFNHAIDFIDPTQVSASEVTLAINRQLMFLEAFDLSSTSIKQVGLRTTAGSSEYQITGGLANNVLHFNTLLQLDPDIIVDGLPSAYIFDPVGQLFTVTRIKSSLSQQVNGGSIIPYISLADASSFPNKPGKFLVNFGRAKQEGPINYNSRPNNSTLLIDASYVFQNEHVVDSMVNFISDQPTLPRVTGDDYAFYITGTESARAAAQDLLKKLLASGVVIRFLIDFPEFLFTCIIASAPDSLYDPNYKGSLSGSVPLIF